MIIAQSHQKKKSLDKWTDKKIDSQYMSNRLHSIGLNGRAFRMGNCSQEIFSLSCEAGCDVHRIFNASLCRDRLCPVCQWRRARVLTAKTTTAIELSECRVIAVTLTLRNCEPTELKTQLKLLSKACSRLMRFKRLSFVQGYIRTIEITHNAKSDTFHGHIHALWTVPESYFLKSNSDYLGHTELCALWQKAAGVDYLPSCRIQAVKRGDENAAVREVAKYISKGSDVAGLSDTNLLTYANAVKGFRMFASAGNLKVSDKDIEAGMLKAGEDDTPKEICPTCGARMIETTHTFDGRKYVKKDSSYYIHPNEPPQNIKTLPGQQAGHYVFHNCTVNIVQY